MNYMHNKYILGMLIPLSGCINQAVHNIPASTDLSKIKTVCVEHFKPDKRQLNVSIAEALGKFNIEASAAEQCPDSVDAVMTYRDKWRWDMSTYMLGLTIKLNDPDTGFPLAESHALHTSLSRQSPKETIDEVLTNLFSKQNKAR